MVSEYGKDSLVLWKAIGSAKTGTIENQNRKEDEVSFFVMSFHRTRRAFAPMPGKRKRLRCLLGISVEYTYR